MERVKKIFRLVHLVVWALFSFLVSVQFNADDSVHWGSTASGFIATCLYVFYGHFYLLTRYAGQRRSRGYRLGLAVIILTGPLPFLLSHYRPVSFSYYIGHQLTVAIFIFLSWLARITETLVLNTIKKEQLEKQAAETELHYLKGQINPHFLFNTLNNIHALVYKQAPAAPDAVMQLASLMRYMIYESNAATVPLARELAYVQDYVSLQQLRYRNSPVVDLRIEGDTEAYAIAPLLFVHLLENAYKHSPARLQPGDLQVHVALREDVLTFRVHNPIGPKTANLLEEPGGIGLPNVRKRLALLYPDQHTLTIHDTGATFTVVLTIRGLPVLTHERKAQLLHH